MGFIAAITRVIKRQPQPHAKSISERKVDTIVKVFRRKNVPKVARVSLCAVKHSNGEKYFILHMATRTPIGALRWNSQKIGHSSLAIQYYDEISLAMDMISEKL